MDDKVRLTTIRRLGRLLWSFVEYDRNLFLPKYSAECPTEYSAEIFFVPNILQFTEYSFSEDSEHLGFGRSLSSLMVFPLSPKISLLLPFTSTEFCFPDNRRVC